MADRSTFIDTAHRVIRTEAQGLMLLADGLGDSFADAIEMLLAAKGRVVVCGMGKSGHIARKIAATLASTGTPAQFVHPAEASHGDLGMLAKGDVVLVLSYSGETPELADVISHVKRFGIPLIGIAGRPNSTLITQADVALLLPQADEACGVGVVPSTSTTMTLALGDALAIALMEVREFTPQNFREFHPGGRLGAQLSRVRDLMHGGDEMPLIRIDQKMSDVLLTMSEKGFGVAGILDRADTLTGIITDGDLRRHMDGLLEQTAADVMTPSPLTIAPDALAEEAVALMNRRKVTCLFVTDPEQGNTPLGLLRLHDCLRVGLG